MKSFAVLAGLLLMAGVVFVKIRDMFPRMDAVAWTVIIIGFGAWILVALKIESWFDRLKLWPTRFSEEQRQWAAVLLAYGFGALMLYFGWTIVGKYLADHFGVMTF